MREKIASWKIAGVVVLLLSSQQAIAETHEVLLLDKEPFAIPGPAISVKPGDTIKWVNPPRDGGGLHTITQEGCFTAGACEVDSEILRPGDEYTHTFSNPGVYPYRCRQHFAMRGTITVESEDEKRARIRKEAKTPRKAHGGRD